MVPELSRALAFLGVALQASGELEDSVKTYELHLDFCRKVAGFSFAGSSYINLGEILYSGGRVKEAALLAAEGCEQLKPLGLPEADMLQQKQAEWRRR